MISEAPDQSIFDRRSRLSDLLVSFFAFAAVTVITYTPPIHADTPEKSDELTHVRQRIDELERAVAEEQIQFQTARDEILAIEKALHQARRDSDAYDVELRDKAEHIKSLQKERQNLDLIYRDTADNVAATLIAKYRLWQQPPMKLLVSNDDLGDIQRYLRYYDFVANANNDKLQSQMDQREATARIERALKLEADRLRQMQATAAERLRNLEDALERRSQLAKALEQLLKENTGALGQLMEDEKKLATLVESIATPRTVDAPTSQPFSQFKGHLSWPTIGPIEKAPGGAMREGGAKWGGVLIGSAPGAKVSAIADGEIAFADWFRNLGLLVIIDHGDGYMSLYGHNQELFAKSGDRVRTGDVVAVVGDTGGHSASGLYFEIRQNGVPEDPRQWCAR